jgi:hypothetical protein
MDTKLRANWLLALAVGALPQKAVAWAKSSNRRGPLSARHKRLACRKFSRAAFTGLLQRLGRGEALQKAPAGGRTPVVEGFQGRRVVLGQGLA